MATAEACSWSAERGWAGPRVHQQLREITELPQGFLGNAQGVHRCEGWNVGPVPNGMIGIWSCLLDAAQKWPSTGAQGPVGGFAVDLCNDGPRESSGVFFIKQRKRGIRPAATKSIGLLPGCPNKFEDFKFWNKILTKYSRTTTRLDQLTYKDFKR